MSILRMFLLFAVIFVSTVAVLTFLSGCETEPMRFYNVVKFRSEVQYFRDQRGNCFAVVGIRKTGSVSMTGIGLSAVPDENCR